MDFMKIFFLTDNNNLKQQEVQISQMQNVKAFLGFDYFNLNTIETTRWFFQQIKTLF